MKERWKVSLRRSRGDWLWTVRNPAGGSQRANAPGSLGAAWGQAVRNTSLKPGELYDLSVNGRPSVEIRGAERWMDLVPGAG